MTNISRLEPGQSVEVNGYCIICLRMRSGKHRYNVQTRLGQSSWYNPLGAMSLDQVNQLIGGEQ
jgi:hypothetical protein